MSSSSKDHPEEDEFEEKNQLIHVIYENGDFREDLRDSFDRWSITQLGFDYKVCGVLGPQSSGKSTLLNLLFGSSFPMLDEGERHQCTKGIWMGRARASKAAEALLLLDVEGTDGRERGDEEVAFERKTSLFSLVLSEILLVNMWASDVGRNNAANLPLLKTVFDLNLQLFASEKRNRTMLLFVLRDHVPQQTAKEKLVKLIREDMSKIWSELPSAVGKSMDDYFVFEFVALPHKLLAKEEFNAGVRKLSSRFNDPSDADYLWRPEFKDASIPMDGLAHFAGAIWDTIRLNKDLDLPSQREMLAMFRCEEIANGAYEAFVAGLAPVRAQVVGKKQLLEDFGAQCGALLGDALANYDEPASRYHEDTVARKRATLLASLLKDVKDVWTSHVALATDAQLTRFEEALRSALGPAGGEEETQTTLDFQAVVEALKGEHQSEWEARVVAAVPEEAGASWEYEIARDQLLAAFDELVSREREKQLRLVLAQVKKDLLGLGLVLDDVLEEAQPDMWARVRAAFAEQCGSLNEDLVARLKMFSLNEKELAKALADVDKTQREFLRKKITAQVHTLDYRMEKRFDAVFKVDEAGVPRVWKPGVDVAPIFQKAREHALHLLHLFTVLRLDEEDDSLGIRIEGLELEETQVRTPEPEQVLIKRGEASKLLEKFNAHARSVADDANRAIEHYGKETQVPMLMVGLMCVLGFNEAMYIISNPLLLVLFALIGGGAFVLHKLGMLKFVTQAASKFMRDLLGVVMAQAEAPEAKEKTE